MASKCFEFEIKKSVTVVLVGFILWYKWAYDALNG